MSIKIQKYFEANENESIASNMGDTAKAVLTKKIIALCAHIWKEE